jgi:hypothetical protein
VKAENACSHSINTHFRLVDSNHPRCVSKTTAHSLSLQAPDDSLRHSHRSATEILDFLLLQIRDHRWASLIACGRHLSDAAERPLRSGVGQFPLRTRLLHHRVHIRERALPFLLAFDSLSALWRPDAARAVVSFGAYALARSGLYVRYFNHGLDGCEQASTDAAGRQPSCSHRRDSLHRVRFRLGPGPIQRALSQRTVSHPQYLFHSTMADCPFDLNSLSFNY